MRYPLMQQYTAMGHWSQQSRPAPGSSRRRWSRAPWQRDRRPETVRRTPRPVALPLRD